MDLIVILIALVALQIWGARNPLHRDQWLRRWSKVVTRAPGCAKSPLAAVIVSIGLPVVLVLVAAAWLPALLWFLLALIILLYSLGRGEFAPDVRAYALACGDNAWPAATAKAHLQGVKLDSITTGDWAELNKKMLEAAAYQGFERLFAVLFWFLVFGPAGALLYRLLFLHHRDAEVGAEQKRLSARLLWALEWPAVRVLGLSFAITGNFVGCFNRWQRQLLAENASAEVLRETVLGALSVDDELVHSCDCTQREVTALKRLYARTLWFWVGALALITLLY